MSLFSALRGFFADRLAPFLANLGKSVVRDEAAALEPLAKVAVQAAISAVLAAAESGSAASLGGVLANLVTATAHQAEKEALRVGATSILAAVGNALASNPATTNNLAVVVKPQ